MSVFVTFFRGTRQKYPIGGGASKASEAEVWGGEKMSQWEGGGGSSCSDSNLGESNDEDDATDKMAKKTALGDRYPM